MLRCNAKNSITDQMKEIFVVEMITTDTSGLKG